MYFVVCDGGLTCAFFELNFSGTFLRMFLLLFLHFLINNILQKCFCHVGYNLQFLRFELFYLLRNIDGSKPLQFLANYLKL